MLFLPTVQNVGKFWYAFTKAFCVLDMVIICTVYSEVWGRKNMHIQFGSETDVAYRGFQAGVVWAAASLFFKDFVEFKDNVILK